MRERERITADQVLEFMRSRAYRPLTFGELARAFSATGRRRKELAQLLEALEADGKVVKTRAQRYGVPERMNLVVGRVQAHPKGFAFVIPERDDQGDVFVAPAHLGSAMHNDRVIVRVMGRARGAQRAEGEVIRILQRANRQIVGRLENFRGYAFVTPVDPRITYDVFVPADGVGEAQTGDIVLVEITAWPERRRSPEGRVVRRVGSEGERDVGIEVIILRHGLNPRFPDDVLAEAERVPAHVTREDWVGRRDLRALPTVTIDGEDAKDLDDAVSLEPGREGRWRLGVHIADVSHYVPEDSALDREARRRGTSVYLVDRVIPMLPEALSNGICSLHPGVERLALSVFMEIDEQGRVVRYELTPSVIRSDERLTYEAVYRMLAEKDASLRRRYGDFLPMLEGMHELAQLLFRRRLRRGSIDFDLPEVKVVLDERGRPLELRPVRRNLATQIIEEFMILCNETVARHHARRRVPFVYRIHEPPSEEAVRELEAFMALLGLSLRRRGDQKVKPRDFQRLLERVKGRDEEYLVNSVALRTMERARYASENVGHFGLASRCYTHFTSPIRRYPDLTIHRIVKELLTRGRLDPARRERLVKDLPEIAQHASLTERQAEEAERETVELKKAEFMADKLGEIYTGIVSGVTSFGLFVQLPNLVEGLVHVSTMTDDYYRFDDRRYTLVGERRGRAFRLGDRVRVQVVRVNRDERLVDFHLVEDEG